MPSNQSPQIPPSNRISRSPASRQFQHPTLVEDVAHALVSSGVDPARMQLEITESVAMEDAGLAVATLHRLKALGRSTTSAPAIPAWPT